MFFFNFSTLQAQNVDEEYMNLAKKYKASYPDDEVVILSSKEKYTFDITNPNKGKPTVMAFKDVSEEYIALKDFVSIFFGEGYDSFSEVLRLSAEENSGRRYKKVPLNVNEREYSSEDIFDNDYRYKYLILPMNTLGNRYLGTYSKRISDVRYLTSTYFLDRFPTLEKIIEIEIPSELDLEIKEFNFNGYTIKKDVMENSKGKSKTITYTINNVKGIPSEKYTPDVSKIFPHLVFSAKSFKDKDGKKIQIFENTADQYQWYKSLVAKIEDNDKDLKPLADKLTAGKANDIDKIKSIYYWVQDNIKYIAFERGVAGFQPEAASMVYKNKFGDCKGMANLLTTLLKLAGFDARLVWIGTTDKPYDYSLSSLLVDNHMICALKYNNKFYFLDGTEKYIAFDDYAERIQGRQALVEDGENYILQNVPSLPIERNKYLEDKKITMEGDKLMAKVNEIYHGESQTGFLRSINDVANTKRETVLRNVLSGYDKNIEVSNISKTEFENRELPIEISYDATITNKITHLGKETYVSIDYSNDLESLLTDAKRKNPIEVSRNILREYKTELSLPAGFKVKSLPQQIDIKTNEYSFSVVYAQEADKVILRKNIMMKSHITDIRNLTQWNDHLKRLKEINNEQIVLEKL